MNDVLALTAAAACVSALGVAVSAGRLVRRVRAERHLVKKIAENPDLKNCLNPRCNIALSNDAWVCGNCGRPQTGGEPLAVGGSVNVSILGGFNLVIPKYKDLVTKVLTRELIPSEQKAILTALEQPSVGGQQEYMLKLLKQVGKHRTQLSRRHVH